MANKTYHLHPLSGNELPKPYKTRLTKIDLNNKSICIFTIGPVQSFISSAKKTKDFWAGSYLLSYLIWQALETVISKSDPKSVIFPYIKDNPLYKRFHENHEKKVDIEALDMPTLPNRFVAVLDEDKAVSILEECEKKVRKKLIGITKDNSLKIKLDSDKHKRLVNQLEEFLEVYWIAIPFPKSIEEVKKRYQELGKKKIKDKSLYGSVNIIV